MTRTNGLLLDTDVVTDLRSADPSAAVVDFLRRRGHVRIFVSALTLGELHGPDRHEFRSGTDAWLRELTERHGPNILPVDAEVAMTWAALPSRPETPAVPALIAATALRSGLAVVTGRTALYRSLRVPTIDPWKVVQASPDARMIAAGMNPVAP